MNGGWRYSVTVPSWTQATLEGEEAVVFYRIEVGIMPPDHQGEPRTRSVLRRFSHFQKLQRMVLGDDLQLREETGKDAVAALGAAPRWSPFSVVKKPEQVERRRRELEAWLWRLIGDPKVARSRVLNYFLELTDAARLARSPAPSAAGDTPPMGLRSGSLASGAGFHGSEDTASDFDDTASDTSFFAAGGGGAEAQLRSSGAAGGDPFPPQPGDLFGGFGGGPGSAGGSAAGSPARATAANTQSSVTELRLGLRVEHRGTIRRLVRSLQQRLEQASHDMQDAVERMRTDQETKRELFERITALEAAAAAAAGTAAAPPAGNSAAAAGGRPGGGAGDASPPRTPPSPGMPPGSPPELVAQLAAERLRTADLQKALQEETGRILELQAQLAAVSAQPPQQPQAPQQPWAEPPGAPAELDPVAASDVAAPSATVPDLEPAAAGDLATAAAGSSSSPAAELQQTREELQAAQSRLESEAEVNRAKQKLLAKEVKSLRKQLDDAKAAASAAASSQAAPMGPGVEPASHASPSPGAASLGHRPLLAEVAALRQRLADCAVESMASASEPEQPGEAGSTGAQLLQTSDDRLQALAAEAALLAADPGGWSQDETQLRAAFATVLQENAQLHKAVNAALRAGTDAGAPASPAASPQRAGRGGGTHSVFGRLSGALHNDGRGQNAAPSASPPRDSGGQGPGAQFADLRSRLSNRFRSSSSPEQLPPPDE